LEFLPVCFDVQDCPLIRWACVRFPNSAELITKGGLAVALALISGGAFLYGRSAAGEELTPSRTMNQITRDIRIAKEQLS